ncbi:MAG: hypothetical protein A2Y62_16625 [Candidatus Fischerbacteria bacterium RBG_13_37_8]|uniref:FAD/NAD(P)-binding domain-containing protein n=1 Tax=Candidatus Fischerbacteria bacterium RBG_13_37_8 TaxID=1817863 RepID=A0A1F5VNW3_9BACT|nr:MAG: hypothetical protein A2Y62_16625 [Candidatus Fischerbacteria bacterium RBG_13_37_8]
MNIIMNKNVFDVTIIGGGSSGLHAARKLSAEGLNVLVLEKKKNIGKHIICTGIVGVQAFEEFELSKDSIMTEIRDIKMFSPQQKFVTFKHRGPLAYVVNREMFNKYLELRALGSGACINEGFHVTDIVRENDHLIVDAFDAEKGNARFYARMIILATGVEVNLNKSLALGQPKHYLHGVQAELPMKNIDTTLVYVGNDIAPGAFAWVVPLHNIIADPFKKGESDFKDTIVLARVGLMTDNNPRDAFKKFLERLISENKLINREGAKYITGKDSKQDELFIDNFIAQNKVQCKAIAQGLVSKTYADRAIAVGEAAGQVKTTTGGGIYFGLICADIAAKVITEAFKNNDLSAKALSHYEKLWKKALRKEIQIGYYARKISGKFSDSQIEKIFHIAQTDGIMPLVDEKANFDWHSSLIVSLIRKSTMHKFFHS